MKKRRRKTNPVVCWLIRLALTGLAFAGILTLITLMGGFGPMPRHDELRNLRDERATRVYSSDGKMIGKIFSRNRTPVPLEEVPSSLIDALIVTEDLRFFNHNGIDNRSLLRVLIKSILMGNREAGGGSTLTQQLAKNLYGRRKLGFLTVPVAKIREAILAIRMEEVYTKEEILSLYLNTVPFGEEVYGVEAASNRYFNKTVKDLGVEESALLVGMLKANTYYHPRLHPERSRKRRNLVLELMKQQGKIDSTEAVRLQELPLKLDYSNFRLEGPAQYFLFQVEKQAREILARKTNPGRDRVWDIEKDGLNIITTLDLRLQEMALRSVSEHLSVMQPLLVKDRGIRKLKDDFYREHASRNGEKRLREIWTWEGTKVDSMSVADSLWHYYAMLHAGVYAVEPFTGKIRIWVGGNHFRYLPYDLVRARRQVASSFKPYLYTAALENGFSPCDYLDNESRIYPDYDDWKPDNYDGTKGGETALWYALAHSLNLPTVDLYFRLGFEPLEYFCLRFGLPPLPREKPALALGAYDLSLTEAIRLYACLGAGGKLAEPYMIERITGPEGQVLYEHDREEPARVMREEIAGQMTAMLRRVVNEGTAVPMRTAWGVQADVAGKTGTSQEYSDSWFFWYTPGLAGGVWVGARDPEVHFSTGGYGSGTALALPVAGRLLNSMEARRDLSTAYLPPFDLPYFSEWSMECEGIREKDAFRDIWEEIFGRPRHRPARDTLEDSREVRLRDLIRELFRRRDTEREE
ncbi:MAG: transglycosylase domain-containing protein [Bacteroidales bacterium]